MREEARSAETDKLHVVAVGGGHGLAATIRAARRYARRVTAIVSTADDGGSTGRLRSGLALPAPGDVRHCLVAMAGGPSGIGGPGGPGGPGTGRRASGAAGPLAEALEYRFAGTDVEGHALGNLVLAALTAVTGDFVEAVDEAARLLALDPDEARVLPATAEPVELRARTRASGPEVVGQVAVSQTPGIESVRVVPERPPAPADAVDALREADQIILGPGSLYTSVLAAAVVDDVRRALAEARGQRVYICNLRAEAGETRGYDVAGHVAALARHGVQPDVVVVQPGSLPLGDVGIRVVEADVARPHGLAHDSEKLAAALEALI